MERSGKAQKNLALNAAPIDVAEFLRRRLFESDTSIIMTSATLAVKAKVESRESKDESRTKALDPRPSTLDVAAELFCQARRRAKRRRCCRSARRSITSGR